MFMLSIYNKLITTKYYHNFECYQWSKIEEVHSKINQIYKFIARK